LNFKLFSSPIAADTNRNTNKQTGGMAKNESSRLTGSRRATGSEPSQSYDILRFSTTFRDAAPVRERSFARQLIDRRALHWWSLVT
jgi:hypothetical protein